MITPPLIAPQLKAIHAQYHVKNLTRTIEGMGPPTPVSAPITRPDGSRYVEVGRTPLLPQHTALLVGDVLHNLRSALDIMACDLARVNEKSTKQVYFPFAESELALHGPKGAIKKKNFDRCGAQAVETLLSLKPFKGGNIALRSIHDANVADKHIDLIPVHLGYEIEHLQIDGVNIYELFLIGPEPPMCFNIGDNPVIRGKTSKWLAFPTDSIFGDKGVIPTLHDLCETVKGVIDLFGANVLGTTYHSIPYPSRALDAV